MASMEPTLNEKDFQNWLKGAISILYAKEGLTEFVQNEIEQFKEDVLLTCIKQNRLPSGTKCSACTTANVLSCPTNGFCRKFGKCNAHDTNIPEKRPSRPCPYGVCNTFKELIHGQHRYAGPAWKNTDATRWCTDAFEIAKCFQPPNSSHIQSLTETDFNGVISIIINNKRFQNKIRANLNTEPNVCTKAQDAANAIWHSADHLLPDKDLANFIDDMIALFCDQAFLAQEPNAQNVVTILKWLKLNTVIGTDDVVALKDSLRASFAKFDNPEEERIKTVNDQHFVDPMDEFAAELTKYKSKILTDIQKQAAEKQETNYSELSALSNTDQYADKLMFPFVQKDSVTVVSMQQFDEMLPDQDTLIMVQMTFEKYKKWISTGDSVKLNDNHVSSIPRIIGIEPCYWECCLQSPEDILARQITDSTPLPDQNYLNRLQKQYLETKSVYISDLLKNIERRVCNAVKAKTKDIQYVWLAYTQNNDHDVAVKLILETNGHDTTFIPEDIPYEYNVVHYNSFSEEAKIVMADCDDFDELSFWELSEIRNCIQRNSDAWLTSHKHLSIIDASTVRSKGYNSCPSEHEVIPEKCMVFYVRKKGFVPIGEEPFESKYDGFPIDVREGVFYTLMQASTESQDKLKMGQTIYKRLSTNETKLSAEETIYERLTTEETNDKRISTGEYKRGTLGGFIDHPQYGLCGLTCAHVLLDDVEMTRLQDKGELSWLDFTPESASVYIKDKNAGNNIRNYIKIGRLVKAVITKGENGSHGMEIAIFQIETNFPSNGLFEISQVDDHLRFDSGKTYGPSRLRKGMNVFKYGSTTGKTSGVIIEQVPVTTVSTLADLFPAKIVMHNQLKIKGINDTAFAAKGDSGAFVLIGEHNEDVFCVGIVEGILSFNNITIVTPIGPVLEKMSVSSLKRFEIDHTLTSVRRLERSLEQTNRHIEQTKNELRGSVKDLETNTNRRLENNLEEMKTILQENKNAIQENVNRVDRDLTSTRAEILTALHNLKQTEKRNHFCIII